MSLFKVKVYKENETEIIGAEVIVMDNNGIAIDSISITDANTLSQLKEDLDFAVNNQYSDDNVKNLITTEQIPATKIDAEKLAGHTANEFSLSTHSHGLDYAPKEHSSTNTIYGKATETQYGHTKIVKNLTTEDETNAVSLHANQGKILNDKLNKLLTEFNKESSFVIGREGYSDPGEKAGLINIQRGQQIYAKITPFAAGNNPEGRAVAFFINGVYYDRTTDNKGKAYLAINLDRKDYFVNAIIKGDNDLNKQATSVVLRVN